MAVLVTYTRPLGAQQRNWLAFLSANPGKHYLELPKKERVIMESLQQKGLVSMNASQLKGKRGVSVWEVEALF